jgi:hypothetical protein
MRHVVGALVLLSVYASAGPASANPYDDCVLQHVGSAQNQTAVYAIERACINKTSVPMSLTDSGTILDSSRAWAGSFNMGSGYLQPGMVFEITNDTHFDITQVKIYVVKIGGGIQHIYKISNFRAPLRTGTFLSGLGEPGLTQVIKSGDSRQFVVEIPYADNKNGNFFKEYSWSVIPSEGIPTK